MQGLDVILGGVLQRIPSTDRYPGTNGIRIASRTESLVLAPSQAQALSCRTP